MNVLVYLIVEGGFQTILFLGVIFQVEEQEEVDIAKGYTMTQFCDKIIDLFLNEKTKSKEWRKYLVFREEWNKYRNNFYNRCQKRADMEKDPTMKEKLILLGRRVKKKKLCSYIACEKIKSLVKAKDLDSSLILLINGACAKAKESTTMKEEV
ncbi:hypothetical protein AHAS_Ahas17G0205300 [Arachis hypogaea]